MLTKLVSRKMIEWSAKSFIEKMWRGLKSRDLIFKLISNKNVIRKKCEKFKRTKNYVFKNWMQIKPSKSGSINDFHIHAKRKLIMLKCILMFINLIKSAKHSLHSYIIITHFNDHKIARSLITTLNVQFKMP